jgi:hypothetical protein
MKYRQDSGVFCALESRTWNSHSWRCCDSGIPFWGEIHWGDTREGFSSQAPTKANATIPARNLVRLRAGMVLYRGFGRSRLAAAILGLLFLSICELTGIFASGLTTAKM